jgi:hypothetical protein
MIGILERARQRFGGWAMTALLASVALSLVAATTAPAAAQQVCAPAVQGGGLQTYPLLAGQTIDAGTVSVAVSGSNVLVTYATSGGWQLSAAHLWTGNQISDLPQTKTGNPIPGKFTYVSGDITGKTTYTFTIPLSILSFSCPSEAVSYYMAAHAAVRKTKADGTYQTETGWSQGSPITSRGNWATFSTFTLTCECTTPPGLVVACDTAFAKGTPSISFLDLGFERWGWTNGPLGTGSYSMDIWAGAAQSDTTKGTHVGTLSVLYDDTYDAAVVTYQMSPGFWMEETHLYVGSDRLPKFKQGNKFVETVAPGQYPYIHDDLEGVTRDSYAVSPLSGFIYVVAHAVVCHWQQQ